MTRRRQGPPAEFWAASGKPYLFFAWPFDQPSLAGDGGNSNHGLGAAIEWACRRSWWSLGNRAASSVFVSIQPFVSICS